MKKYIFIICIILIACKNNTKSNSNALNGKYEIKKAIVESTLDFLGLNNNTTILMFDDYGDKYKQIKTDESGFLNGNTKITTITILDKDYMYFWEEGSKSGTKIKLDQTEDDILAQRFNFKKVNKSFREKYKLETLESKTVGGKKCDVYQMEIEKSKIKYYVWKNIPLSFELEMEGKTIKSNLVKLDENPSFKPNEFELPKEIHFEEITLDETQN